MPFLVSGAFSLTTSRFTFSDRRASTRSSSGAGVALGVGGSPSRCSFIMRTMPHHLSLVPFIITATFSVAAADVGAQPQNMPAGDGFTPIFDGRSLHGWKAPDMTYWRISEGAITGEVTLEHMPKENSFLAWQGEPVKDFELKFSFRIFGKEANSGMQFRSEVKDRGLVHGYQADIDGAGKFAAGIWDEYGTRKSLAARGERATWDADGKKTAGKIADPFEGKPADLTQWTEYHITAIGNKITLRVNGKLACELIDADPKKQRLSGVLAVPVIPKPMKVQYKEIRLKRLEDAKAADAAQPNAGVPAKGPLSKELAEARFNDTALRERWTKAWESAAIAETRKHSVSE